MLTCFDTLCSLLAKILIWKRGKGCVCIVHCSSHPKLAQFSTSYQRIQAAGRWLCCSWPSLLCWHVFVQDDFDVVDAVAQVIADVGAHVVPVQTQHWCTSSVHQGAELLTEAAARNREENLKLNFKQLAQYLRDICSYLYSVIWYTTTMSVATH